MNKVDSSKLLKQRLEERLRDALPAGLSDANALLRELDGLVDAWHRASSGVPISAFMNLTAAEYSDFVAGPLRFAAEVLAESDAGVARRQRAAIDLFRPGVYRHYKGNHYLALGLARADETDETVVVYTRLYEREGLPMSTRTLEIWNQLVEVDGRGVPRFAYAGHQTP